MKISTCRAVRVYLCRFRFLVAPPESLPDRAFIIGMKILKKLKESGPKATATAIYNRVNRLKLVKDIQRSGTAGVEASVSKFHLALLEYLGIMDRQAITPLQKLHLDFALSANERGEHISDLISSYSEIEGKRYLDIGCAYGGFLAAFAKRGARQVIGMDISPDLLRLAKLNLDDQGVNGKLLHQDILDESALELGKFDIVTCNDVIEHVLDPAKCIRHISRLVNNGGLAFFEIPNPFYEPFIREDGHFKLPGITLLSRRDAMRFYSEYFGAGPEEYSVGFYHSLRYYYTQLQRHGFRVSIVNDLSFLSLCNLMSGFENLAEDLRRMIALTTISPYLAQKILYRAETLACIFQDEITREWSIFRHDAKNQILLRYGVSFWKIVAKKL